MIQVIIQYVLPMSAGNSLSPKINSSFAYGKIANIVVKSTRIMQLRPSAKNRAHYYMHGRMRAKANDSAHARESRNMAIKTRKVGFPRKKVLETRRSYYLSAAALLRTLSANNFSRFKPHQTSITSFELDCILETG